MSRRTVSLTASQLSFLDYRACNIVRESAIIQGTNPRPSKRRKIDPRADDWAAILEFVIECPFQEGATICSTSSITESSFVGAVIDFNDSVMSVSNSGTGQVLFGYVCDEESSEVFEKVFWLDKLASKDPSISRCVRCQTSVSIQGGYSGAVVSVLVEVQFDHNLVNVTKFPPKERIAILDYAFQKQFSEVSPDQFYSELGRLPKDYIDAEREKEIQHPSISCTLFPFQRRAVAWMLERERRLPETCGDNSERENMPALWETLVDLKNRPLYVNRHQGYLTLDKTYVSKYFLPEKTYGGLLAEEMGLGKTIEIIDLMLLNPRPASEDTVFISPDGKILRPSKATIIISPPTIFSQWAAELADRAPTLNVFIYTGIQNLPADFDYDSFLEYDVILMSYSILAKEVHYAIPPPKRSMRYQKVHVSRRSPLTEFSWWRVCLDEAQMIEGSVTAAATMACMLSRSNAWCISGTPCKKDVSDLHGLLVFLRYQPIANNPSLWYRICHDWDTFQRIFRSLVCRNTKHYVKDEMALPPQTKALLSVDFTAVEEINYQHVFEQMLDDCGLTPTGTPIRQNWVLNDRIVEKMKKWLVRLRQACSHPGVGTWRSGTKEMRTMEEVLDKMYEDTCTAISKDEREQFIARIKRGQIYDFQKQHKEALEVWEEVFADTSERVNTKLAEVLELKGSVGEEVDSDSDSSDGSEIGDVEDNRKAKKIKFLRTKRGNELRELQSLQHRATFMMASANFQLGNQEEETRLYDQAELLRRKILRHPIRRANHFIKRLNDLAAEQDFVEIPEFKQSDFSGGILTRKVFERLQPFVDQMNEQANQLDEWREEIIRRLSLPLLDQTVDPDGEEYQAGLDVQEEASSYQEVLRQAVAGRIQATSGFVNELVRDDILRQKNIGPELTPLAADLWKKREEIQPQLPQSEPPLDHEFVSLKGAIDVLRNLVGTISDDVNSENPGKGNLKRNEIAIAQIEIKRLQQILAEENKSNSALEKEVEFFRVVYNARIEYYRQLQLLSDTLENYSGEDPEGDLQKLTQTETQLEPKISRNLARRRYLQELRSWQSKVDQERLCVICQSTFDVGALTKCGHLFCFACLQIWLKNHHTCPVCKERLGHHDWHKIATQKTNVVLRGTESSHQDHSFSEAIYQAVDGKVLQQIQLVELKTSFGSKIDNLTRHLLWIKSRGGAKSIVFSQWADVLDVMERSFKLNGIGYVRFDQKQRRGEDVVKRFKTSDEIQVFMLHSQSQSSGLSLVDATHCFLVEPLINSAIELQAVSRIHRLGQTKPTFVWLYTVNGTVEDRVLDVSTRKRFEDLKNTKTEGDSCEPAPTLEPKLDESEARGLQQHLGRLLENRGAGEVVETGELWKCLFGNKGNQSIREQAMKEVQRDQHASAAENRINGVA